MLSFGKIFTGFLLCIAYYLITYHFLEDLLNLNTSDENSKSHPFHPLITIAKPSGKEPPWRSYHNYAAIPSFYIKRGFVESTNLITIVSICDIHLLYEAVNIAQNYKTGPLSFAIYIDQDYKETNTTEIHNTIHEHFKNVSLIYDIHIAILAINTSDHYYRDIYRYRNFNESTPIAFKIPVNTMRNLAESMVETDWILNIDIDFWYLSATLNDNDHVQSLIEDMNTMISSKHYGEKTVFVVPSFEIIMETADKFEYSSLTKRQLTDLIYLEEIIPFHETMWAQKCTKYDIWYKASGPYILDFRHVFCHWPYEPWFIIHKDVSTQPQYHFDGGYIGRGLNKVERVVKLRHLCFNFIIMHDLFMIHAPDTLVLHHELVTDEQKEFWHGYNLEIFQSQFGEYLNKLKADPTSCMGLWHDKSLPPNIQQKFDMDQEGQEGGQDGDTTYSDAYQQNLMTYGVKKRYRERRNWIEHDSGQNDVFCENGVLGKAMHKGHCRVCCEQKCGGFCGGHGCGRVDFHCCVGNIYNTGRLCNESIAPCEMTISDHCPSPIDYVSIS